MFRITMSLLALVSTASQAQITLSATPLSAEQVSAFYIARGFSATDIAPDAEACVLSLEFRNADRTALHFRLAEWQTGDGIGFRPLAAWDATWEGLGVSLAARTAFRWAQFPAEQEFEAGDWIMGMAALTRRPSGKFSLIARDHDARGSHDTVVDLLSCPHD